VAPFAIGAVCLKPPIQELVRLLLEEQRRFAQTAIIAGNAASHERTAVFRGRFEDFAHRARKMERLTSETL
jgi:hypothetical protein